MTGVTTRCSRCESPLEREDLRCPICNAVAPALEAEDRQDTVVEVLRCNGCGAAVSYDVRARAPACAFCGSVMRVEVPVDPVEEVEFYLPFTVDRSQAEDSYRSWLGSLGWFRPSDLRSASRLEEMTPLWWVGWVVSADADVTWAADSDADSRRSEWAPHAGRTTMAFEDVVASGSRGLSGAETERLIPTYDLATQTDVPDERVTGTTVEIFDIPRSSARKHVVSFIRRMVTGRLEKDHIPGKRFRNVHAAIVLRRLETRRCAFPSFVVAYRYRGELFRVVVSGQDSSCLIGTAPYSLARILAVVFGGALALAVLVGLIAALV